MSNEVANFIPFEATRVGWTPSKELDWDEYVSVGKDIACAEAATQWWIGDWYNQGYAYGEHEAACIAAGIDYSNARKCATVCKSFELLRRRNNVSFSHHQALASLPEDQQEFWLDKCEKEHIPRASLREFLSGRTPTGNKITTLNEWAINVMAPMTLINSKDFFGNEKSEQIADALLNVICSISQRFPGEEARQYRRMLNEIKVGAEKLLAAHDLMPATYDISLVKED